MQISNFPAFLSSTKFYQHEAWCSSNFVPFLRLTWSFYCHVEAFRIVFTFSFIYHQLLEFLISKNVPWHTSTIEPPPSHPDPPNHHPAVQICHVTKRSHFLSIDFWLFRCWQLITLPTMPWIFRVADARREKWIESKQRLEDDDDEMRWEDENDDFPPVLIKKFRVDIY